ncbi:FAD-dependent oxidoreductase [Clostridium septicum]|uniref:dihydrouracil dehydrogenase (NAD(+)) n=1 Tax=Clostridium septicum TaxID=1504 RepID=A0A9N7PKE6_CLOSE|nr:FAD-dependent oxidoreductase [Clostridium septicum]AYE35595.1 dihydropyrimidine dehydrogenase [Clostridium septicum]MDU1313190.1 FAD-dependent oxidoreductase [Clostridium septicum]QAS60981.1 dihydropyrimidine dehydrogenase [Clostridium septicum]UEC19740.1 FAD-dependent oxidoreductase [Clostridium septicum]USS02200.1 FAD-dependent oxidoreductase [Clostridium septicum]
MSEKMLTPYFAIEESARCLLCHDAPCSKACPVGTDPAKFIRSLRFRNLKGAVETIRENNVLGGICARVCPTAKYCEGACSRSGIDRPIEIAKIQRYLTDYEKVLGLQILEKVNLNKEKVAIIGSGPSGLGAATKLVSLGYNVTVFEEKDKLGGWLTYGIPEERLPKEVIENEISYIRNLGVEFKTNCKIGRDKTIEQLKKEGFKAILVSVGMQKNRKVDIIGANLEGVINGTDLLSEVKVLNKNRLGNKVIVIGGGDVAIDCATTANILGCDVKLVYRRTIDKMPADRASVEYLQSLNIPIFTGFKPKEIIGKGNKVERFKAVGMFDDSVIELPADNVIFAIGQEPTNVDSIANLNISDSGVIVTQDYKTNIEGIFASGDITEGDKTVVFALKEGKEAAKAIDNYLRKADSRKEGAK